MRFVYLFPLVLMSLVPLVQPIFLLGTTAAATTGTITSIGIGAGGAAALGIGAVAVVGALALAALAGGSGRGKRDTDGMSCMPMNNPEFFLTLAANSDSLGCGLRLICELEATADEALSTDEALILSLFGRNVSPPKQSDLKKNNKSGFQYAALVGSLAKHVSECAAVFDECPWDRVTLMKLFTEGKNVL